MTSPTKSVEGVKVTSPFSSTLKLPWFGTVNVSSIPGVLGSKSIVDGSTTPSGSTSLLLILNVTGWLTGVLSLSSVAMGGLSMTSTVILPWLVRLPVVSSTV